MELECGNQKHVNSKILRRGYKINVYVICRLINSVIFGHKIKVIMHRIVIVGFILFLAGCQTQKEEDGTKLTDQTQPDHVQSLYVGQDLPLDSTLTTIAIGSCNRQDLPQEMWPFILKKEPQLWIWLGDNIYGDSEDMQVMIDKYQKQKFSNAYRSFREQVPVLGIWDDHDYGVNDGGKEYPKRDTSASLMMDFLDVDKDAEVRQRPGVYQSYTFGREGQKVKILLLDTRYFRDSLERTTGPNRRYLPNETGTILGEDQWFWLERELRNSDAQVHIIASSIQVISAEHRFEKWANFPQERQRLFDLIADTKPARPLLLSGDRHISELSMIRIDGWEKPVYDLTSSGMTHTWSLGGTEANAFRQSDLIAKLSYGLIRINWKGDEPLIRVEANGLQGENYMDIALSY